MIFRYREHLSGFDTNIHVAILSRFPITARRPHANDSFLLGGRRLRVSRGFAEVDLQVNSNYSFTLITAHLKSKRPVPEADEAEERLAEAKIMRGIISERLASNPSANLVVAGDFNDTKDSAPIKTILGRGKSKLLDTRPAERNGDSAPNPPFESRAVTWTHYYGKEDTYSRIDYILLSPGMAREWVPSESCVLTIRIGASPRITGPLWRRLKRRTSDAAPPPTAPPAAPAFPATPRISTGVRSPGQVV